MKNGVLDFGVIKFFGINTCIGKVLCPSPVRWEFPSLGWVKINTDEAARGYLGLSTFSVGVWGNLLEPSLRFLKFKLFWLLSFMELYKL